MLAQGSRLAFCVRGGRAQTVCGSTGGRTRWCNEIGTPLPERREGVRTSEAAPMSDIRTDTAFAVRMTGSVDTEGFPLGGAWETGPPGSLSFGLAGKEWRQAAGNTGAADVE